jgi:hypothetical protein
MSKEINEIKDAAGDYKRWALEARKKYIELRLRQDVEILNLYIRVVKRVADELRKQSLSDGNIVNIRRLYELERFLIEEARYFTDELDGMLKNYVEEAVEAGASYSKAVLVSLLSSAEIDLKVDAFYARINRQAIEAVWARTHNGLYLSDRIWKQSEKFRSAMRDIIQESVAIGQDAVKTAEMLEKYVKKGAKTLAKDYPNMMERVKGRIPNDISYEALRLVRTETTAAFGEGTILAARATPSYIGMRWVLSASHPKEDVCDGIAAHDEGLGKGVYSPGNEPKFPAHPNCLCILVPVHESPEKFVERLKRWNNNHSSEPTIENWYQNIYQRGWLF